MCVCMYSAYRSWQTRTLFNTSKNGQLQNSATKGPFCNVHSSAKYSVSTDIPVHSNTRDGHALPLNPCLQGGCTGGGERERERKRDRQKKQKERNISHYSPRRVCAQTYMYEQTCPHMHTCTHVYTTHTYIHMCMCAYSSMHLCRYTGA
jgi:hypothetical protein